MDAASKAPSVDARSGSCPVPFLTLSLPLGEGLMSFAEAGTCSCSFAVCSEGGCSHLSALSGVEVTSPCAQTSELCDTAAPGGICKPRGCAATFSEERLLLGLKDLDGSCWSTFSADLFRASCWFEAEPPSAGTSGSILGLPSPSVNGHIFKDEAFEAEPLVFVSGFAWLRLPSATFSAIAVANGWRVPERRTELRAEWYRPLRLGAGAVTALCRNPSRRSSPSWTSWERLVMLGADQASAAY